jgi:DNA mismatch endonuclease (patch repair protein)
MRRQARDSTGPEMKVRKLLHAQGLRYRVQVPVPDMTRRTMDICFQRAKVAVYIDGCFWHGCPKHATAPKANADWWRAKLERNQRRDVETSVHLEELGWTVMRFWAHEPPADVVEIIRVTVSSAIAALRPGGR